KQRLEAIGTKHSKIKLRAKPREFDFAPGTILLREWGEREHRVTVTAEGLFEYQGRNFKSLTAVARHITGAHWSGPLFFGLSKGGARRARSPVPRLASAASSTAGCPRMHGLPWSSTTSTPKRRRATPASPASDPRVGFRWPT